MLAKILAPFTTATASGVAVRDITMIIGAILAVLGALGFLSADQVEELTRQAPALLLAIGTAITGAVSIYRQLTKSSSDKAAAVAKQVDAYLPAAAPVDIPTPPGTPDVHVPGVVK